MRRMHTRVVCVTDVPTRTLNGTTVFVFCNTIKDSCVIYITFISWFNLEQESPCDVHLSNTFWFSNAWKLFNEKTNSFDLADEWMKQVFTDTTGALIATGSINIADSRTIPWLIVDLIPSLCEEYFMKKVNF